MMLSPTLPKTRYRARLTTFTPRWKLDAVTIDC